MQEESIKIPRKVRRVVGPSSLLGARGMPTLEATWIMVLTLLVQTGFGRANRKVVVQVMHQVLDPVIMLK